MVDLLRRAACRRQIARAGGTYSFRVIHEGHRVGETVPGEPRGLHAEAGGGFPIVSLERQTGRNGGQRVGGGELALIQPVDGGKLGGEFLSALVLALLEVGVDHVVHGVELIEGSSAAVQSLRLGDGRARRGRIGDDGIVPKSQPGEDVRRHMLGVRGIRRDFGVGARRGQSEFRGRRVVHTVNDVMGDAGVIRVLRQQPIENRGALSLPLVCLVGGIEITDGD